ncbi:bifunctional diguanylate cyclase/phosphodiesterase [Marinobacterium sp. YM272]|uniref:bifunctional diguanylate cyclase/phosphodiesterase n=1 Tax=Marinobacterium sp. YM272 TaxID=3421654 RepID=UPI003D7FCCE9
MSLVNQLIAAVMAVLIGLASGTLYVMSESGKSMLLRQLESHAQDSATHLGLYIAPYMASRDSAAIETAVNAIFDSGFYQRISVLDPEGEPLFIKETPPRISDEVPNWFVSLIDIEPPSMQRSITHQWRHVGVIHVQSSAGYAYERFWEAAQRALILFVVLAILAALIINLLLRYLLKPLKTVERQAQALAQKTYIEQPQLPKTRELRSVVLAMNTMVRQVRQMFDEQTRTIEELRSIAYRDPLTGLLNQRAATAQLQERIDYDRDFGPATLVLVRLRALSEINHQTGEENTNHLLKLIAESLREVADHGGRALVGRLSGAEFVLLTEQQPLQHLKPRLEKLLERVDSQLMALYDDNPVPAQAMLLGVSHTADPGDSSQLISEARLATKEAEQRQVAIQEYASSATMENRSHSWHQHVASAISNCQVFLQYQRLIDAQGAPVHGELLARILDEENAPCPAGRFIGVARDLGLLDAMDRAVILRALAHIRRQPDAIAVAINLGRDSLLASGFARWLGEQLAGLSQPEKINFEINETVILNNTESVLALKEQLHTFRVKLGVDNFGVHPQGFSYLYRLQPDYVKIDGSLIRDIDRNDEDRFFVRSLIGVAHNIQVSVYAEHVERDSQLEQLRVLGIDGTQGYLHGRPRALD